MRRSLRSPRSGAASALLFAIGFASGACSDTSEPPAAPPRPSTSGGGGGSSAGGSGSGGQAAAGAGGKAGPMGGSGGAGQSGASAAAGAAGNGGTVAGGGGSSGAAGGSGSSASAGAAGSSTGGASSGSPPAKSVPGSEIVGSIKELRAALDGDELVVSFVRSQAFPAYDSGDFSLATRGSDGGWAVVEVTDHQDKAHVKASALYVKAGQAQIAYLFEDVEKKAPKELRIAKEAADGTFVEATVPGTGTLLGAGISAAFDAAGGAHFTYASKAPDKIRYIGPQTTGSFEIAGDLGSAAFPSVRIGVAANGEPIIAVTDSFTPAEPVALLRRNAGTWTTASFGPNLLPVGAEWVSVDYQALGFSTVSQGKIVGSAGDVVEQALGPDGLGAPQILFSAPSQDLYSEGQVALAAGPDGARAVCFETDTASGGSVFCARKAAGVSSAFVRIGSEEDRVQSPVVIYRKGAFHVVAARRLGTDPIRTELIEAELP